MKKVDEYLRRNLLHAASVGVQAGIGAAIDGLAVRRNAPKWLIKILYETHSKAYDVSKEMAKHRDEVKL